MNVSDPRLPDPRMISPWQAPPEMERPAAVRPSTRRDQHVSSHHDEGVFVRPYLVTGGRTRPVRDGLRVETLVHAAPAALHAPLTFERRRLVDLCQSPRSVAEVAVGLTLPFGVARVLVADLITDGFVTIYESSDITIDMLERIRDRVRAL